MAGSINLAGSVGMTGKRESVLSDLPAITQNVGDSIVKSMQLNKENKIKATQLLEQQNQKKQADDLNDFEKHITVQYKDLDPRLSAGFKDDAIRESNKFYQTFNDPKATPAQKDQARLDAMLKIQQYHNMYKSDEQDFDKHIKRKENDIYNTEDADKVLAGIGQDVEENLPNTLMNQPNAINRNDVISTPNDSKLVETRVRDDYFKLPMDERRKIVPNTLDEALSGKTKLARVTPSEAVDKVIPKFKWDALIKENNKDGNLSFETNEKQSLSNENDFAYAVTEGQNKEARILKEYLTIETFNELAEKNQNLTPTQRAEAIKIGVEAKARAIYKQEEEARKFAVIEDRKSRTIKQPSPYRDLDATKTDYTPAEAPIVKSTLKQKRIDEIIKQNNEVAQANALLARDIKDLKSGDDGFSKKSKEILKNNETLKKLREERERLGNPQIKVKTNYGVAPTGTTKFNLVIPNVGAKEVDFKGLFKGDDGKDYLAYAYKTGDKSDIVTDYIEYSKNVEKDLTDGKLFGNKVDYVKDVAEKQKIGSWRKENVSSQSKKEEKALNGIKYTYDEIKAFGKQKNKTDKEIEALWNTMK